MLPVTLGYLLRKQISQQSLSRGVSLVQEPEWGNVKKEAQYLPSSSHWPVPYNDSKSTAFGICWAWVQVSTTP